MYRINPYIILLTVIATLGGLLFDHDTAVISRAMGSLRAFFIEPRNLDPDIVNLLLGFVISSALIGGIIGGWGSTNIGQIRDNFIAWNQLAASLAART